MKKLFFTLLIILPLIVLGNMAKPWVDGSKHSLLYGSENCDVLEEYINIQILNSERDILYTKYNIKYIINSDVEQSLPLLFIGIGLSNNKNIIVNGNPSEILKFDSENPSLIKFAKNDSLAVDENHLIYFKASLNKGTNIIEVGYDADLEYNTFGFTKTYKLEYSLYPSKFWKTFGTINLDIPLNKDIKITSSNIGTPTIENDVAKWKIKKIDVENIELSVSKKISWFSEILLFIDPFGIACISLIILIILHIKMIKSHYQQKKIKYKLVKLYGGVLLIPILFYVIYFSSYNLIDFSLGQENSKHGYVFLFIVTLPILILFYGITIYIVNTKIAAKHT